LKNTGEMESRIPIRILLIGKGGRESALAFKLSQLPRVEKIFVVPGNGGTAKGSEKVSNIGWISEEGFPGLVKLATDLKVNLVVPGGRQILR
jgi:phosphoribosylamine--glycine ligase/phosphoribosylformylglycinamidine cyclo-ligase